MSDFSVDMVSNIESGENENADGLDTAFIDTLPLGVLSLELYALASLLAEEQALVLQLQKRLELLWPFFYQEIVKAGIPQDLGLTIGEQQQWQAELTFVDNHEIQALNRDYREKDQATDVLTFCALADQSPAMTKTLLSLPEINLGSVFVSIPWAQDAVKDNPGTLQVYLLERVFHGFLHLLGAHHDTMEDYERVKGIQDRVIAHLSDI